MVAGPGHRVRIVLCGHHVPRLGHAGEDKQDCRQRARAGCQRDFVEQEQVGVGCGCVACAVVCAHGVGVPACAYSAVPHLLATGSDDCSFKVWDLRYVRTASPTPVAHFKWHTKPIVSVEWHPSDETSLVVASADGQVTLWDMSVEADTTTNESKSDPTLEGVPPQLLFVHQGQQDVKEVHHHPQVPDMVISTAADGFNFFIADLTPPDLAGDAAAAGKK